MYRSLEGCKRLVAKVLSAAMIPTAKSLLQPSRLRYINYPNPGRCPGLSHFRALRAKIHVISDFSRRQAGA